MFFFSKHDQDIAENKTFKQVIRYACVCPLTYRLGRTWVLLHHWRGYYLLFRSSNTKKHPPFTSLEQQHRLRVQATSIFKRSASRALPLLPRNGLIIYSNSLQASHNAPFTRYLSCRRELLHAFRARSSWGVDGRR
jgi:hypothetical protein